MQKLDLKTEVKRIMISTYSGSSALVI